MWFQLSQRNNVAEGAFPQSVQPALLKRAAAGGVSGEGFTATPRHAKSSLRRRPLDTCISIANHTSPTGATSGLMQ